MFENLARWERAHMPSEMFEMAVWCCLHPDQGRLVCRGLQQIRPDTFVLYPRR